jgi:hypothetical protein
MDAIYSTETLGSIRTLRRYNPEDLTHINPSANQEVPFFYPSRMFITGLKKASKWIPSHHHINPIQLLILVFWSPILIFNFPSTSPSSQWSLVFSFSDPNLYSSHLCHEFYTSVNPIRLELIILLLRSINYASTYLRVWFGSKDLDSYWGGEVLESSLCRDTDPKLFRVFSQSLQANTDILLLRFVVNHL